MSMRLSLMWSCIIAILNCTSSAQAQSDLCVSYAIEDIKTCTSSSNWAVNTPNLTVNHNITTSANLPYLISYALEFNGSNNALCAYTYDGSVCAVGSFSDFCLDCTVFNNADGSTLLDIDLFIPTIRDGSTLKYTLPATADFGTVLQQLSTSVCRLEVTNAAAFNVSEDPCGYGCESKFNCLPNFQNDSYYDFTTIHRCNAAADWDKPPPQCSSSPQEVTTTTTMLVTTTAEETTESTTGQAKSTTSTSSSNATQGSGSEKSSALKQEQSAHAMTGLAAGAGATYSSMQVYSRHFESDGNIPKEHKERINVLLLAFVACMCVLGISLGLLYGLADNMAAFISGTTVGTLALLGLVVLAVLHGRAMKMNKRKL